MMTIVTMGCSTPPVGVALYTCSNIMDCSVQETTKYSLPLFIAILATLAICVFFPDLVLFLPNMIYGTVCNPLFYKSCMGCLKRAGRAGLFVLSFLA